ncbi:metallophosphoesterase [Candidatus Latescibacterota bacterium]
MKRRSFFKTSAVAGLAGIAAASCAKPAIPERKKLFSFVHFSDVHVQPEKGAREGFLKAIEKMNSLEPDFAVSGGDLVSDSLAVDESRAVMLYDMYKECSRQFTVPLYNVMGNHEVFGIRVPDLVPEDHPEWGKEMFKKRLGEGKTYRSFDHKGIHFLLLDSVGIEKSEGEPGHNYIGEIGSEQMAWLRDDLTAMAPQTPVIAVAHIPLFTLYPQIQSGPTFASARSTVLTDGKELFELLMQHRLFGFLEGHIHVNETYIYKDARFIDTAAVSGNWWDGDRDGHPEGFNLVHVYEDGIESEYITYGWDASKYAGENISRPIPYFESVLA